MIDNDNIKALYNQLTTDKYDVGTFEQFTNALRDDNNIKALHEQLTTDKYDVGNLEQFSNAVKKKDETIPTPEKSLVGDLPLQSKDNQAYLDYKKDNPDIYMGGGKNTIPPISTEQLGQIADKQKHQDALLPNTLGTDISKPISFYDKSLSFEKQKKVKKEAKNYQWADSKTKLADPMEGRFNVDEHKTTSLQYILGNSINESSIGLASNLLSGKKMVDFDKYEPNVYEEVASSMIGLLVWDLPLFALTGGIGNVTARTTGALIKAGLSKTMAEEAVTKAMLNYTSKIAPVLRSAEQFGYFEQIKNAETQLINIRDKKGSLSDFSWGENLKQRGIGEVLGAGLGGINLAGEEVGKNIKAIQDRTLQKAAKVGLETGKVGTEAGYFTVATPLLSGEDRPITLKDYLVNLAMVGGAKLSGAFSKSKNFDETKVNTGDFKVELKPETIDKIEPNKTSDDIIKDLSDNPEKLKEVIEDKDIPILEKDKLNWAINGVKPEAEPEITQLGIKQSEDNITTIEVKNSAGDLVDSKTYDNPQEANNDALTLQARIQEVQNLKLATELNVKERLNVTNELIKSGISADDLQHAKNILPELRNAEERKVIDKFNDLVQQQHDIREKEKIKAEKEAEKTKQTTAEETKSSTEKTIPDGFREVEPNEVIPAGDYDTHLDLTTQKTITNAPKIEQPKSAPDIPVTTKTETVGNAKDKESENKQTESPQLLTEKEFRKKYVGQHKDLRSKNEIEREDTKKSIIDNGFNKEQFVNVSAIKRGNEKGFEARYSNQKGDIVYLIPKEYIIESGNGNKVKGGYKPTENEIIKIEYDNQPTYEAYKNQIENKTTDPEIKPVVEVKSENDITVPKENKSILNQDTDLKGYKKDKWQKTPQQQYLESDLVDELRKEYPELSDKRLLEDFPYEITKENIAMKDIPVLKLAGDYVKIIKTALEKGKYQQSVKDGRMTAEDAKTIIESAGLEVPKDILDLIKPSEKEVKPSEDKGLNKGAEISPNKEVKANQNIAIKEILQHRGLGLKELEAGVLFGKFKDLDVEGETPTENSANNIIKLDKPFEQAIANKLEDKGYLEGKWGDFDYSLTEQGKDFIDAVKKRLETRKAVKAGTDLFPELANIPELQTKIKELKDNGITDEQLKSVTGQDEKQLEQTTQDIESKANSTSEADLNEAIRKADEIIKPDLVKEPVKLKGDDLIAQGIDKLRSAISGNNIIGEERPTVIEALTDIGKGLIQKGIATIDNVWEKVKDYLKDSKYSEKDIESLKDDFIKGIEPPKEKEIPKTDIEQGDAFETSLKRAVADNEKENREGVEAVENMVNSLQSTDVKAIYEDAKIGVSNGKIDVRAVTDRVIKDRTGSTKDEAVLLYERGRLRNKEIQLLKEIDKTDNKDLKIKLENERLDIKEQMERNDLAAATIGREASSIFRLRQAYVDNEMTIFSMKREFMTTRGLKELTTEQEKYIQDMYDTLKKQEIKVSDLQEQLDNEVKTRVALEKKFNELRKEAKEQRKQDRSVKSADRITQSNVRIDKSKSKLKQLVYGQASAGVNPEIAIEVIKIAKEKVYQGVVKADELIKNVLDEVKDILPDWTEKDVREHLAYTKKGKEQTEQSKIFNTLKKTAAVKSRIENKDFESSKKTEKELTQQLHDARVEYTQTQWKWKLEQIKASQANRGKIEKFVAKAIKLRTAIGLLSGIKTIAKLLHYTAMETLMGEPLDILTTGIARVITPKIANKSMTEGYLDMKAERAWAKSWVQKRTYKEAWDYRKTQNSYIDLLYGDYKKISRLPDEFGISGGKVHAVEKYPLRKAELQKQYIKIENHYRREGYTDEQLKSEKMQKLIGAQALEKANYRIMQSDNRLSKALKHIQGYMYQNGQAGKIGYYISKALFPIVTVPTNYTIRTARAWGGLFEFGYRAMQGAKNMTPEQADKTILAFKNGLPGAALGLIILYSPNFITYGDDRKLRLFGMEIPPYLQHHPLILSAKLYAESKEAYQKEGLYEAISTLPIKTMHETPYLSDRTMSLIDNPEKFKAFLQNFVISWVNPQIVKDIASMTDTREGSYDAQSFTEKYLSGVPILNKKVPKTTPEEQEGMNIRVERNKERKKLYKQAIHQEKINKLKN